MKRTTGISWALRTWNCVHGCNKASEGCDNCYSLDLTCNKEHGESKDGKGTPFKGMGLTYTGRDGRPRWTGKVVLSSGRMNDPLGWKTPLWTTTRNVAGCSPIALPGGAIAHPPVSF